MRRLFELGAVMLVFPAIVATAVRREPGRIGGTVFGVLGAVSYAVYVLHQPLGTLAGLVLARLRGPAGPTPLTAAAFLVAIVVTAALADKLYDQPVRRWLSAVRIRRGVRLEQQGA